MSTSNEKKAPQNRTYTVDDIAAILGIGRSSAYKLAKSGAFKIIRIGLMVGGVAKTAKSASVIACILYFPMLIFSGATLPIEVMPSAMQKVISVFPLTQGIQLMKATSLGLSTENILTPIIVMVVVTMVCIGIAIKCFRWE